VFGFNFISKDSFVDYGILIEKRPVIPKPARNINYIEVPGRNGSLRVDDLTYKDLIIPFKCGFKDDGIANKADVIKAWLDGGEGPLILSNQPDKYYLAHVSDQFDIAQEWKVFGRFLVNFRCKPFKYSTNNTPIALVNAGVLINPGTVTSEPVILVMGSGNITLMVNGTAVNLVSVVGSITIDSVLRDAYNGSVLQNNQMASDFPVLVPGNNTISWTGTVTSVQVTPNWRWL